jgi:hypothetical protein
VEHLTAIGVLDGWALTDLGEQLREAQPWLDAEGPLGRADLAALHLLDAVRSGRPAYELAYGRDYWQDLAADPARNAAFDALMSARLHADLPGIVAGYDWGALSHVVDVGGGDGTLLAAILAAHPGLRGTLVELAGTAESARRTLGDRAEIVVGSFFEPLPAGADAYVLSGVLCDWDDAHALQILRRCAEAGGRVLVIDHCELAASAQSGDLRMLVYTGGRERTLAGLQRLAGDAGLHVVTAEQVTPLRTLVDLRAAAR